MAAVVDVLVSIGSVDPLGATDASLLTTGSIDPVGSTEASLLATGSIDPVGMTEASLLWTAPDCGSAVFVVAGLVALRGALVAELAGSLPATRSVGSGAIVPTTRWSARVAPSRRQCSARA
ncbi:MAG: hypothetical protein ACREBE_27825 [bacterium]